MVVTAQECLEPQLDTASAGQVNRENGWDSRQT